MSSLANLTFSHNILPSCATQNNLNVHHGPKDQRNTAGQILTKGSSKDWGQLPRPSQVAIL